MSMTDAEKIEWFDGLMKWFDQLGGAEEATQQADDSHDAPYDLFFDALEQYKKDRDL